MSSSFFSNYPFKRWCSVLILSFVSYVFLATARSSEGSDQRVFFQSFTSEEVSQIWLYQEPQKDDSAHEHHPHEESRPQRKESALSVPLPDEKILEKVIVLRQENDWISQTHHQAICNRSVQDLFRILFPAGSEFLGEVRTFDAGLHHLFELEPSHALHLVLKNRQGHKLAHLLIGKEDARLQRNFLREISTRQAQNDHRVILAGPSLRSFFNLSQPHAPIPPKIMVDLTLISEEWLEKNQMEISEVVFSTPTSHYEMYLKKYFPPQIRNNQVVAEEWLLKAPVSATLNESFESILKIFSNVVAEDIAESPYDLKKYQLENPPFLAQILYSGPKEHSVRIGYNRHEGKWVGCYGDKKRVYQFSDYDGQSLFESFGDLIDFPSFGFSSDALKIQVKREQEFYVLEKKGRLWNLIEPSFPFLIQQEKVEEFFSALADLRPANIVTKMNIETVFPSPEKDFAQLQLSFLNRSETFRVGGVSPSSPEERFVWTSQRRGLFTAKTKEMMALFPPLSKLLNLTLFQNDPAFAVSILREQQGSIEILEKTDHGWRSQTTPEKKVAPEKLQAFLEVFRLLKAQDFWEQTLDTSVEKTRFVLQYSNQKNGVFWVGRLASRYFLQMEGYSFVFEIPESVAQSIMALFDSP